ncbi:phosphatidylinositol 4,5-bisphosphate 3-kinase catalytic subunit gamma isoform-like [Narcine bancroftii]|uniref:phosphatidylinositol 4,5-bisphosphate 3-kinase catalytic subunit gamma isoform-like n=1 Tax=Narcine bancroftii TaxID=1343680 RepID=UPI0038312CB0
MEDRGPVMDEEDHGPVVDMEECGPVVNEEDCGPVVDKEERGMVVNMEEHGLVADEEERGLVVDKDREPDTMRPLTNRGTLLLTCALPTPCPIDGQSEVVTLELPVSGTVRSLRLLAWMKAANKSCSPGTYQQSSPDAFRLFYCQGPTWYEIFDDNQPLLMLDALSYWRALGLEKGLIYMELRPEEAQSGLSTLIGLDLQASVTSLQSELNSARRRLAAVRQAEILHRDSMAYAMEPCLDSSPLSEALLAQATKPLVVAIHHGCSYRKMKVSASHTPDQVVQAYAQKVAERGAALAEGLVLKVCSREEYLTWNQPLLHFSWVRHCLKNKEELRLVLVRPPAVEDDEVTIPDWPLVDEGLGLATGPLWGIGSEEEVRVLSLWDCAHPFRVKLLGLDFPTVPVRNPSHVCIKASVLHGTRVLSSVTSLPKPLAQEVLWNTWLDFPLLVRDLPWGCRLSLSVYSTEELELQGKGRPLHLVSLLLIDHHWLLRQGHCLLHMWPCPSPNEAQLSHRLDQLSCKNNPELENSAAICIVLDTYRCPVALPKSSAPGRHQPHGEWEIPQQKLLKGFREQCGRYSQSLPTFLGSVCWANWQAVQEVHWLLQSWEPQELDLAVALQLLEASFGDQGVRSLAVRRLEALGTEQLLQYLLQLVQALKFEPYHDSSLARFLIGRALKSKRIGHFFFWYCRSEVMSSPLFSDRYAVVLEAYLMGCGRAMLESFQQQVHLVTTLSRVATSIKSAIPEKGDIPPNAATLLQELLQREDLPEEFVTPYDPHIRAGRILLDRCKVMASKKKPLWLEFTCPDPTGAPCQPIGIIFKHGDDLRQDMLILQTLVIMNSIWQENSLNLNLIPYGCIATGYNIGIIQAVQNAVTIAAMQRMKGGNGGAFKNDALHDWLRAKLPVEEVYYHAMETFVTSCAGYCVATYVLGIGDRHNDNIMITEQGNLFHIDFGHILGNRKRILGVNREQVPFVLTPDFLFVMGRVNRKPSLYFQRFKDTCIQAYLSLRAHAPLLINLFSLMLLTGIPELSCAEDIAYLQEALMVGSDEQAAREHFLNLIGICESLGWTVQASWWIHMFMGIKQA